MFRLAHISDPHLGPLPTPSFSELLSKRITGYANWRFNRKSGHNPQYLNQLIADIQSKNPDHLAITGDLVNLALPSEITNAAAWMQSLGNAHDISFVPGNHDAYVSGIRDQALKLWAPWVTGDRSNRSQNSVPGQQYGIFPYKRHRGPVALIGVSTAIATAPFMATGKIGRQQCHMLEQLLQTERENGTFRVIMIHHPPLLNSTPKYKRLIDTTRFQQIIARAGAELVIHGHTHVNSIGYIDGPDDNAVPVIGVPAASAAPGGHKPASRYNLFSIEGQTGSWNCQWEEFGYNQTNPDLVSRLSTRTLIQAGQCRSL
ncbi:MAG: metallophosphoesterase [Cohaesibacteraceae bacterium]|nr:metallophosphoesterase [Cohaesibacteraceae bacterium]MBL4876037.1 metallophosphoesterase [Cohaesibacteraceae bacterium]